MEKGVRLQGNGQAPVHLYWEEILNDYLIPGKFSTELMVTHRVPIDDFKELYDKFDRRVGGVMKVFVETKFSSRTFRPSLQTPSSNPFRGIVS